MEGKHPVSLLQELMARQYKKLPEYIIIDISTKLCPNFECKVRIEGIEGVAIASSKQNAKKLAAQDALKQLGFGADNKIAEALNHYQSNTRQPTVNYNAIGKLNEYAAKSRLSYPSYDECGINSNNEFIIKCSILDYSVEGSAPTKKVAKQVAANNMLKYLEDNKLINVITSPSTTQTNVISDRAITEKFKNLSFKCSKYPPLRRYENAVTAVEKFEHDSESEGLDEEDLPETVQDITYELEERNISFNVEVVTKDPCVLLLKIDNGQNTTVVESGKSYKETYAKLMRSAIKVIRALNMKNTK